MKHELDEATKRSLEAAARLVRGSDDAILILEFVYRLGLMDGPELRELAGAAHNSTVRCRLQPRKGPVRAPFPPRTRP